MPWWTAAPALEGVSAADGGMRPLLSVAVANLRFDNPEAYHLLRWG